MKLISKYAVILYAIIALTFLIVGFLFHVLFFDVSKENPIFLSMIILIGIVMLFTSVYNIFRYILIDDKLVIKRGFNTTNLDYTEIKSIEVKPFNSYMNKRYNSKKIQRIRVFIKTATDDITFWYVGRINDKFWYEVNKIVQVTIEKT